MPKEALLWRNNVRRLSAFGVIERIEDAIKVGVSDCVYCLRWQDEPPRVGFIELKRLLAWPKRSTTPVRLPHYSNEQVNFLERWGRAGAGAFLLAQVDEDFMLFSWRDARAVFDGLNGARLIEIAAAHGYKQFPHGRILRCLTTI